MRISDLPVLGAPTTLVWLRRFSCANCCERHTEDHPSFDGSITTRLRRRIVCDARHLSIKEISRRYPVSWWRAMEIVRSHTEIVVRHRRAKPCRVLLVDETSLRRRHRYVTVASNGETGEALAVIKHRDQRALSSFLLSQGNRWLRGVEVVVTDGSLSYKAAIDIHLGHATHVLDRFHVVRWFAKALIDVRRRVQRTSDDGSPPAFSPVIFRTRYLQLARHERLNAEQFGRLALALTEDPELFHSWRLLQEIYGVYDAGDEAEARERIESFVHHWHETAILEFRSVLKALAQWMPEILAFHRCGRITNGRLEGTNNKLGVLKRIAYGFTNADNFAARALLWCPPVAS